MIEKKNMSKKYHLGNSEGSEMGYQCPNCSDIQADPKDHRYNMVKFEVGEKEVVCPNCGAFLTRKIID